MPVSNALSNRGTYCSRLLQVQQWLPVQLPPSVQICMGHFNQTRSDCQFTNGIIQPHLLGSRQLPVTSVTSAKVLWHHHFRLVHSGVHHLWRQATAGQRPSRCPAQPAHASVTTRRSVKYYPTQKHTQLPEPMFHVHSCYLKPRRHGKAGGGCLHPQITCAAEVCRSVYKSRRRFLFEHWARVGWKAKHQAHQRQNPAHPGGLRCPSGRRGGSARCR